MTHDEILAMSNDELNAAVADLMGAEPLEHRGWRRFSSGEALHVIVHFKMTVTPKIDATEKSRWLADFELKTDEQLWLGYGPTVGIAVCRAVLLRQHYQERR